MPGKQEIPSTVARSSGKAQRTWVETHDSAVEQYGEGEQAHRTAFASLKHSFEKVGDHWEAKDHKGPSDERSEKSTAAKRRGEGETAGGVDELGHTKAELYARAKHLGVPNRSRMDKHELAKAIARKQG